MARIGKALGVAYVNIRGDSSKLKGDLDSAKSKVIAAGKRMALGIGVVGLAVAGVGFAIKNLSKEWVRLANEQEAVEKRLSAVVKASGNAAGLSARQMIDMAGAMQKVTTVGDETIIAGQAILATFKNIRGEAFEKTTMAALDMSEVMQQDLRSSIVMLGKALNDPIANLSALSRAGVQFTKEQKEMVNVLWQTGDIAGAQAVILKELESQFGGAAKAAKNTFGGAMKSLDNTIGDFKENLGFAITKNEVFIGLVHDTEKYIVSLVPAVQDAVSEFQNWVKQNRFFIEQDVPRYIRSIGDSFAYMKTIYDSFPDGAKGAAGAGIVGWILFGATGGAQIAAMVYAVNAALVPFNSNLGALGESIKGAYWSLDDLVQALMGNRKGYATDLKKMQQAAAASIKQQQLRPPYITIKPGADITSGDSNKIASLQSTLGITGAERGHMVSAQMAADSAEFVKIANAQYEGLMVGATDSFMGIAAANERANKLIKDNTQTTSDFMKDAFTGWASSYSSTLTDMLWDSELTFADIAESFGKMLTQMAIQKGMVSAAGGVGDWVASLFHDGGVVGSGGSTRSVSPAMFIGAPRLHNGLSPDEFPAILQRGETVISKNGGATVSNKIEVIINGAENPSEVNVRQQQNGDISQIIIDLASKDVSNGGVLGRSIGQTFGLSRRGY